MKFRIFFVVVASFILNAKTSFTSVFPTCPDGIWQLVSKTNTDIHEVGTRIDALSTAVDGTTSAIELALPVIESGLELIDGAVSTLAEHIETLQEYTFSMVETIGSLPIPIVNTPHIISDPGFYTLGDVLSGPIIIDADYVTIDMRGYALYSGMSSAYGIVVLPGHHHIVIENGMIGSMNQAGIAVLGSAESPCDHIAVSRMNISNCAVGISFNDCRESLVSGCLLDGNESGIAFDYVVHTDVKNCTMLSNTHFGCALYKTVAITI